MKTFLISYDLSLPETHADYTSLIKNLKSSYSSWARPVDSVWIIKSNKTAGQIRDDIKIFLDSNDELVVVELSENWATYNISKEVTSWMHDNL